MPTPIIKDDPPPAPPIEPALEDCCQSGCDPCIFDIYQDALERHRLALQQWQARQARQDEASASAISTAQADKPKRRKP